MPMDVGANAQDIRLGNRCLVLKTIATRPFISRGEIAEATGLTRMTMSNIISELMRGGIVSERSVNRPDSGTVGRRPIGLDIADGAPCVCGISIGRKGFSVLIGDFKAGVIASHRERYPEHPNEEILMERVLGAFRALAAKCTRRILGIGIVAMGPVNTEDGMLLAPSNFYGIHNVRLVERISRATGYPSFLMPDNCAGALAEKLYGRGRDDADFLFLLLSNGIGCGIIVDHRPYGGFSGLAGEIGHTVIAYGGRACPCGRRGCLEQYASVPRMQALVKADIQKGEKTLLSHAEPDWCGILGAASLGDAVALRALDEFCEALSCALANYVNVFDPQAIYLCYEGAPAGDVLRQMILRKLSGNLLAREHRSLRIENATFGEQSVELGALAVVNSMVFDGLLPFNIESD